MEQPNYLREASIDPTSGGSRIVSAAQSRAARLIAEAKRAAVDISKRLGDAGEVVALRVECGNLAAQINALCAELEKFRPTRDPHLQYIDCGLPESDHDVTVGFDHQPAEEANLDIESPGFGPGSDEQIEVTEVWLNGADIAPVLLQRVVDALAEKVGERLAEQAREAQEERAIDRWLEFA